MPCKLLWWHHLLVLMYHGCTLSPIIGVIQLFFSFSATTFLLTCLLPRLQNLGCGSFEAMDDVLGHLAFLAAGTGPWNGATVQAL